MLMRSLFGLMLVGTVIGGGIAISGVSESREPLPTKRVANPMPAAKPNFILILGEGHGNSSLPFTQDPALPDARNTGVKMPAFEEVANNGIRFSRFYAASPRCTPTRAALLTGKTSGRLQMTFVNEGRKDDVPNTKMLPPRTSTELAAAETTLPEMLQSAGYATAHFGKWHVGRSNPSTHGFTENDGANNNGGPENVQDPATLQTPKNAVAAVEFVKKQIAAKKPFYVQISQYASKADVDQERMDTALAELQKLLKESGQAENTYILYTTDHGTPGRNSPFKAGKGFLTEGGIRVPLVISGPGIPKGKFVSTPVSTMDIFPTIAELAGVTALPKDIDGGSVVAMLKSGIAGKASGRSEDIYFHFPHYDMNNGGPCSAIVSGDYKLIRYYEDDRFELYNVVTDPSERKNLVMDKPEILKEMTGKLEAYLKSINAGMATKNPNFDPNKPSDGAPQRGRKGGFGPAESTPGEPGQGGGQGGGRGGRGGGGGGRGGRGGNGGGGNGGGNAGGGNGGW